MRQKYADYPNWKRVLEKEYKNKYFDNEDFKGNISLLKAVKVKEKLMVGENNLVVLDDGYKWLELYPEDNKNIAVSVCLSDKDEILEWYFDIAKDTKLTEKGIPYIDDLYLDVIMSKDGKIKMVDEDELQEALDTNDITKEDYNLAYTVANSLIKQIDGNLDKVIENTYKYLKMIEE